MPSERLWIRNGRVVDPASGLDEPGDVLIEGTRIAAVGRGIRPEGAVVLDADGLVVAPGLVDIHVHLREPGEAHKEDIASGTRAAAQGGVTSLVCMANTTPPADDPVVVDAIRWRAKATGAVRVYPVGAVTKGLAGKELSPIAGLAASGVVALSDDGRSVADAGVLRRAMLYSRMFDLPILEHCEDPSLSAGGVMHEGEVSARLGLRGIPRSAEEVMVARDLILAEETGAHVHIQHVSSLGSVRLIREAKARGVRVTAEVTPHHLTLTDESIEGFDPNFKVNPPLRAAEDVEALLEGLRDGTIDCIATDHAPHAPAEKLVPFDLAPFGVIGLETLLGVVLTRLVWQLGWPLGKVLSWLTDRPARTLGLPGGTLRVGAPADVVLIDLEREWRVDPDRFASKSKNTPFAGWILRGKAVATIVDGRVVWMDEGVQGRWVPAEVGAA
jgi:dihydroorotase